MCNWQHSRVFLSRIGFHLLYLSAFFLLHSRDRAVGPMRTHKVSTLVFSRNKSIHHGTKPSRTASVGTVICLFDFSRKNPQHDCKFFADHTTKTQHATWNLADSNFGGPNVLTVFYMALAAGVSSGFICSPKPKKGLWNLLLVTTQSKQHLSAAARHLKDKNNNRKLKSHNFTEHTKIFDYSKKWNMDLVIRRLHGQSCKNVNGQKINCTFAGN